MCRVGAAGQGLHTMTVGLQIPIRWMAPEVLSGQPQYFYASDVWSMGVVVWQLLTRHAEPYPDVPDLMAVVHGYARRQAREAAAQQGTGAGVGDHCAGRRSLIEC